MARPVNADAEATRRRILGAARDLFADRGHDGVSVRSIAQESGVSLATVHHYFGTKAALYHACVESLYADLSGLGAELERAVSAGGTGPTLVERAVRTSFSFARAHRDAIRLLMRRVVAHGELDPDWASRYQGPALDQGARLVAAVTGFSETRARLVLQSLLSLVVRYTLSSPRELALFAGVPAERRDGSAAEPQAIEAIEDHLVDVALRLLDVTGTA